MVSIQYDYLNASQSGAKVPTYYTHTHTGHSAGTTPIPLPFQEQKKKKRNLYTNVTEQQESSVAERRDQFQHPVRMFSDDIWPWILLFPDPWLLDASQKMTHSLVN